MKKLFVLTAAVIASAALAAPALAATKTVNIYDDYFVRKGSEPTVTIHKGDTVKWVWHGRHKHQVFQIGGPGHFHSPPHTGHGTFKHKFTVRGLYEFVSPYDGAKMKLKVK